MNKRKSEGPTDGQKGSSKIRRERYKERSEAFQQFTSSAAPAPFPSVTEDQQLRKHLEESTSQQSIDKLFEKLRGMQVSEWTQDTMREFDSIVPMSDPYKFSKLMTTINVYSKTELTRAYASNDRKTIAEAIETHCITGNSREPPSILVFTCNGCEFQSADEKAYLKHLEIHKTQQELKYYPKCKDCNSIFPNPAALRRHLIQTKKHRGQLSKKEVNERVQEARDKLKIENQTKTRLLSFVIIARSHSKTKRPTELIPPQRNTKKTQNKEDKGSMTV